jgi:ABC-type nitrate/sulfonate/bicarbonate transport system substrate-binding protein
MTGRRPGNHAEPRLQMARRAFVRGIGASVVSACLLRRVWGQSPKTIADAGVLGPPSNGSYFIPIIADQGLDKKHGLIFKPILFNDPGSLYSELASHNTSSCFGAFFNGTNFYVKGLPLQLLFTLSTANHAIVSKDPAITKPQDLQGKTLVAATGSGFYGMARMFLNQYGLDPRKNIDVISASKGGVLTQLLAGKVDAGVTDEPALSNLLSTGFHLVGDMAQGIRQELGMAEAAPVWSIGAFAWKKWIDEDPDRAVAVLRMFQDAAAFYHTQPEAADRLIAVFTKLPVTTLRFSRRYGPGRFQVVPAIDEKANLMKTFEGFRRVGFLTDLPNDQIFYAWPSLKR